MIKLTTKVLLRKYWVDFFSFNCLISSLKIKYKINKLTLTNDFFFLLLNIFLLVTLAVKLNKPL